MVSLTFGDVGLLPYSKPTNQSLTHTQPINEPTNHKPTNHMSTNPNTTNHVSTNPNLPVTSHPITSQPIKINRSHSDQPPHSRPTAMHGPALFCQVALASDVGSAEDTFIHGLHALRQVFRQGAPSRGRRHASGVRSQVIEDSSKRGRGTRKKQKYDIPLPFFETLDTEGRVYKNIARLTSNIFVYLHENPASPPPWFAAHSDLTWWRVVPFSHSVLSHSPGKRFTRYQCLSIRSI